MGGTFDNASFDSFIWLSTPVLRDWLEIAGWVSESFSGAHYWVLKAQTVRAAFWGGVWWFWFSGLRDSNVLSGFVGLTVR
jgi:hypothetical protein